MPEQRNSRRPTLDQAALNGLVVGVTSDGHLQWVAPETAHQQPADEAAPETAQSKLGREVISDQEQALIEANRHKIRELKTLQYANPDLHDIVSDMLALTHPPTISLAVVGWVLQATGLIPLPVFDSAAAAVMGVTYVGRRLGHRLQASQVPEEASEGAKEMWQTHPGVGTQIVMSVMDRVIDSLKNAASVDDEELEDELDAFYPQWSRTDFEFDPRHYQQ